MKCRSCWKEFEKTKGNRIFCCKECYYKQNQEDTKIRNRNTSTFWKRRLEKRQENRIKET